MQISNIKNNRIYSRTSFSSYLTPDGYGIKADRDAVQYKLRLTPQRINETMANAQSTDAGLVAVFKELKDETRHVDEAFVGFNAINKHFFSLANSTLNRHSEGLKKGAVRHLASATTGGKVDLEVQLGYVGCDFKEIIDTHFAKGLARLLTSYAQTIQYFQEGIDYVNMRKGSTPGREKLKERTKELVERYEKPVDNLVARLEKEQDLLVNRNNKILEAYSKRTGRSFRKVLKWVRRILTAGAG